MQSENSLAKRINAFNAEKPTILDTAFFELLDGCSTRQFGEAKDVVDVVPLVVGVATVAGNIIRTTVTDGNLLRQNRQCNLRKYNQYLAHRSCTRKLFLLPISSS